MKDTENALASPLFKALGDIAFSSVMVTRATDEHGASEIVYVNERFSDLTGYGRDEVLGETPGMLQGPKTDGDVLRRLDEEVSQGRVFHGRTVNYRKDGSEFEIEWKVSRVTDIDGVIYYIAVQREAV